MRCKDSSLYRKIIFFFLKILFACYVFFQEKKRKKRLNININIFNCTISKIIVGNSDVPPSSISLEQKHFC